MLHISSAYVKSAHIAQLSYQESSHFATLGPHSELHHRPHVRLAENIPGINFLVVPTCILPTADQLAARSVASRTAALLRSVEAENAINARSHMSAVFHPQHYQCQMYLGARLGHATSLRHGGGPTNRNPESV